MSLSVEEEDGSFHRILEKNTAIPASKTYSFATKRDRQTTISVHVMQGEGKTPAGNISLARFDVTGLPKAGKGEQTVDVTFNIDADGIFQCSYNQGGSTAQQVFLKRTSGYDQEQMAKLLREETAVLELHALLNPPEMEDEPPAKKAESEAPVQSRNGKGGSFIDKIKEAVVKLLQSMGIGK